MDQKIYYVYGLIDPITLNPFYIGKGKNDRAYSHLKLLKGDVYNPRKRKHIEKLLNENKTIEVKFYLSNVSSQEANNKEIELIKQYGRKDIDLNGILLNLAHGGEGGDTSIFFTEESRRKISASSTGVNNQMAKLNEQQVLDIYYSCESTKSLSKKFNVGTAQIICIKRKKSYKNIVNNLTDPPGICTTGKKTRVLLSDDQIKSIYLESNDYLYFNKKYGVSRKTIKSIKEGRVYKRITENLGDPGHYKKYKLSSADIKEIYFSELTLEELSAKFSVHIETIRNIKTLRSRKLDVIVLGSTQRVSA